MPTGRRRAGARSVSCAPAWSGRPVQPSRNNSPYTRSSADLSRFVCEGERAKQGMHLGPPVRHAKHAAERLPAA
jgi:hypothetical protein